MLFCAVFIRISVRFCIVRTPLTSLHKVLKNLGRVICYVVQPCSSLISPDTAIFANSQLLLITQKNTGFFLLLHMTNQLQPVKTPFTFGCSKFRQINKSFTRIYYLLQITELFIFLSHVHCSWSTICTRKRTTVCCLPILYRKVLEKYQHLIWLPWVPMTTLSNLYCLFSLDL